MPVLRLSTLLAASTCAAAAALPAADHVRVNFGASPSTDAVVSFASASQSDSAFVAYSTSPIACGCSCAASAAVLSVAAERIDNSFGNSAGLANVYVADLAGKLQADTSYFYVPCLGVAADAPGRELVITTLGGAGVPRICYWGDLGRDGGGQAWPFLEAEANKTAQRAADACSVGIQNGEQVHTSNAIHSPTHFPNPNRAISLGPWSTCPAAKQFRLRPR